MSSAENSDRRRRVIIMQSDGPESGPEPTHTPPPRPKSRAPDPRRLRESDLPQSVQNEFRRACGQLVPFLIRITSSESGSRPQSVLWDRPSLIIGRSQESDLRLSHAEVSRQHAYLQIVDGRIDCFDLGSGGGTHWPQGANLRQHGPLELGEPVSIGPYSLTVEPAPQFGTFESADQETAPPPKALPDGLFLDFRDATHEPRRWPATRDVTLIGSGNIAKVKLVHSSVSKAHCAVVRAGGVLWVVDLLSEEGTLVNGKLVNTARLESGDEIRIGRFSVAAHYGSPLDDESIRFSAEESGVPSRTKSADQQAELARLQHEALAAAQKQAAGGGVSEQFVLDVISQMGVMQQQALQHARQSMVEALQAVSSTYQSRIDTLEKEYEFLKQQLRGLPGQPPGLPDYAAEYEPLFPFPPGMMEPEYQDLPQPEHGSFECDDPHVREQWVREKMKMVEAELDKARKGWGRRLIELMGY